MRIGVLCGRRPAAWTPWNRIARAAAWVALAWLGGCGGDPSVRKSATPPNPPAGAVEAKSNAPAQPSMRMLKLWDSFPPMHGVALDFEHEYTMPSPISLKEPTVIEFIPGVIGSCDGCSMEVTAVDGAEEIPLAMLPIAALPAKDAPVPAGPERYDFLRSRAELDLSALAGRSVRIRWRLSGAAAASPTPVARIMDFKLRVKRDYSRLPPILFICSDAHRYDHAFGELGARLMPRLNALRGQSVLYSRATSTASWTLPSITSVLTGLYPRFHRTGERVRETTKTEMQSVEFEPGQFSMGRGALYYVFNAYPDRPVTLGEALGERGYSTAMVVSNLFYVVSGLFADGQDWTVEAKVAPGGIVTDSAKALISRLPKDRPLFMLVHYLDVHEFMEARFKVGHPGADPYFADPGELRAYYAAAVEDTDRYLGDLLETWDREIGLDRSMVVFYADHGEHLFDPGYPPLDEKYRQNPDARVELASGLLDHGNTMDEVLLHVPLLVKYPAGMKAAPQPGTEVNEPVSLVDIYPTIFQIIGRPVPNQPDRGRSLLSAGAEGGNGRTFFHDYQLYGPERSAVRKGQHKLVVEEEAQTSTLYDLALPLDEKGEPGTVVNDAATRAELERGREMHMSRAEEATQGLRSTVRIDKRQALEDLEALGYLK